MLVKIGQPRYEAGYWFGMRQPSVLVSVEFVKTEVDATALKRFDGVRAELFANPVDVALLDAAVAKHPVLSRLALFCLDLLAEMGMPVMSGVRAAQVQGPKERYWLLGLPAFSADVPAPQAAINLAGKLINAMSGALLTKLDPIKASLKKLVAAYQSAAPTGVNSLRFLQSAHDLGMPWRHVANNVFQVGWGQRSRWLDSTFTDETPVISTVLARDKMACIKVLNDAGLPVPKHHHVRTVEQALEAAKTLGYPVVVKPADLDGGRGVFAGLKTPASVEKAFAAASALSKRILVEQFIEGNDYRLQVFKGEVFWVTHRRPAKVVGDGASTIEALIEQINRERAVPNPDPDPTIELGSKPIIVDDEVQDWIADQGLSLKSVPDKGQLVRLRGAANVSSGGTRLPVTSSAHPDNVALAVKAAAVMRLDVAGIDFLVPDIATSWRDTGGAICEVNAQPQLSGHLQLELLPKLVRNQGRIPVVALVGAPATWEARESVIDVLAAQGVVVGWASTADACRALQTDPAVGAVLWALPQMPSPIDPAPVDRADLLVHWEVSGEHRTEVLPSRHWPSWASNAKTHWHIVQAGRGPAGGRAVTLTPDLLPVQLLAYLLSGRHEKIGVLT